MVSAVELAADLRAVALNAGQATTVSLAVVTQAATVASRMDPVASPAEPTSSSPIPVALPTPAGTLAAMQSSRTLLWMIGGTLAVIACLAVVIGFGRAMLVGLGSTPPTSTETIAVPTNTTVPTEEPAAIVLATEIIAPTQTPTETASPTLSPTPEGPYVVITGIRVEGASYLYIVDYEVHNPDDTMHVHMFFDTVPPEQAGSPGTGPWKLICNAFGDPPFTQYGIADRPDGATQICSLVARSNHSVIPDTRNCIDLPE